VRAAIGAKNTNGARQLISPHLRRRALQFMRVKQLIQFFLQRMSGVIFKIAGYVQSACSSRGTMASVVLLGAVFIHVGQVQAQERSPSRFSATQPSQAIDARTDASFDPSSSAMSPRSAPPRPVNSVNPDFRYLLSLGYNAGGERLADGGLNAADTKSIKSGQGLEMRIGLEQRLGHDVALQFSLGYHTDTSRGANGSATFSRVPFEFLGFLGGLDAQWRFGGGVRKATHAKFESTEGLSIFGGNGQARSSLGFVIGAEYRFNPHFGFGFRHVRESYSFEGVTQNVKGSHTGFNLCAYF
jgi:hypothetical protein